MIYHYDGKRVGKYDVPIHEDWHVANRVELCKLYAAKERMISSALFFFSFVIISIEIIEYMQSNSAHADD